MSRQLCTERHPLTAARIARFLVELTRHGNASRAAIAAGVPRQTAYDRRATDEAFAALWQAAVDQSRRQPSQVVDPITLATAARISNR